MCHFGFPSWITCVRLYGLSMLQTNSQQIFLHILLTQVFIYIPSSKFFSNKSKSLHLGNINAEIKIKLMENYQAVQHFCHHLTLLMSEPEKCWSLMSPGCHSFINTAGFSSQRELISVVLQGAHLNFYFVVWEKNKWENHFWGIFPQLFTPYLLF